MLEENENFSSRGREATGKREDVREERKQLLWYRTSTVDLLLISSSSLLISPAPTREVFVLFQGDHGSGTRAVQCDPVAMHCFL